MVEEAAPPADTAAQEGNGKKPATKKAPAKKAPAKVAKGAKEPAKVAAKKEPAKTGLVELDGITFRDGSLRLMLFKTLRASKGKFLTRDKVIATIYGSKPPEGPEGALSRITLGLTDMFAKTKAKLEVRTQRLDGVSSLGLFDKGAK